MLRNRITREYASSPALVVARYVGGRVGGDAGGFRAAPRRKKDLVVLVGVQQYLPRRLGEVSARQGQQDAGRQRPLRLHLLRGRHGPKV